MPRSPSRDLADRFDGNRDYFRRPSWVKAGRFWGVVLAAGLVVGWAAFDQLGWSRASSYHTHGELARPHAAWDSDCAACHRPQPGGDLRTAFRAGDRWRDLTCEKCHAGPAHHAAVDTEGQA